MRVRPEAELDAVDAADRQPLVNRLGWMALSWGLSVAAIGAVGFVLRLWLAP